MKRIHLPITNMLLCLLALSGSTLPLLGQEAPSPAGHWEGAILVPGAPIEINVDLMVDDEDVWTGDISIPAQMAEDFSLSDVAVEGTSVSFKMMGPAGDPTFTGTLSEDGKTISGPFTQSGATLEFALTRSGP